MCGVVCGGCVCVLLVWVLVCDCGVVCVCVFVCVRACVRAWLVLCPVALFLFSYTVSLRSNFTTLSSCPLISAL